VLEEVAKEDARVLTDPPPTVSVESYLDNRVVIALRAWTATQDFAEVQRALAEAAKSRLQAAGIKLPV
jgi:small conductance mechanosensitive channel